MSTIYEEFMGSAISFATTPRIAGAVVSSANTNLDGTGTVVTVLTAGSSGSRIDRVRVQAVGATTTGRVRLFLHDGSNYYALEEVAIAGATPSATVSGASNEVSFGDVRPLMLPNGWSIRASTNNANTFHVTVYGADF